MPYNLIRCLDFYLLGLVSKYKDPIDQVLEIVPCDHKMVVAGSRVQRHGGQLGHQCSEIMNLGRVDEWRRWLRLYVGSKNQQNLAVIWVLVTQISDLGNLSNGIVLNQGRGEIIGSILELQSLSCPYDPWKCQIGSCLCILVWGDRQDQRERFVSVYVLSVEKSTNSMEYCGTVTLWDWVEKQYSQRETEQEKLARRTKRTPCHEDKGRRGFQGMIGYYKPSELRTKMNSWVTCHFLAGILCNSLLRGINKFALMVK